MKPSIPILVTSAVFVGTIAVLGVAIERQNAPSAGQGDAAVTNALWNETGFWIYPVYGLCPGLRTKAQPLVFSQKVPRPEQSVADLEYCFQLPERSGGPSVLCQSGSVRLDKDEKSKRYKGTYSLVMADGSKREGSFQAQYCAKGGS